MVMVSDTSDSKEYAIVPLRKPDSLDSEEEAVTFIGQVTRTFGRVRRNVR